MVPLIEDNRVLTKVGLQELERTQKPGLRALLEKLDMAGRPLTSQDVAIRFAPKLNALSRMESGLRPLDIYLVDSSDKAKQLVGQVMQNNVDRVQFQGDGEDLAFRMLEDWPHTSFIFLASNKFHRGVVGLIATKLAIAKGVPCFIASIPVRDSGDMDQSGIVGSGRMPPGSDGSLLEPLEHITEFLSRYGGHKQAAGFEVKNELEISNLVQKMAEFYKAQGTQTISRPAKFDVEAGIADINDSLLKWIDILGPFGKSFEVPLLCVNEAIVSSVKKIKGDHLKIQFKCEDSHILLDSIWFSPPKSVGLNPGDRVRAIGEVQWNYFGARPKVQFLLREMCK
jgi:single-stranded-DNA-specific exonuclease